MSGVLFLAPRLSEHRLQTIGFFASALGAVTQFIQPVLDLLNVHIVR
jgi:hypothetical protein